MRRPQQSTSGGGDPRTPLPYSGWDLTRIEQRGESSLRSHVYDGREITYEFNTLGYRCDEYRGDADFTIFAFGCSHAVGFGLKVEESWTSRFVAHLCERRGIAPERVTFMNFGESGSSADYINRMLISQCGRIKPDLVIMNMPATNRTELCFESWVFDAGEWMESPLYIDELRARVPEGPLERTFDEAVERSGAFIAYSTPMQRTMALIRNVLLAQSYCQAQGIDAILSVNSLQDVIAHCARNHEIFDPLMAAIDLGFLSMSAIDEVAGSDTTLHDKDHFNARAHDRFARLMLDFFDAHERRGALARVGQAAAAARQPESGAREAAAEATASSGTADRSLLRRIWPLRKKPAEINDPNTYPLF